MDLDSSTEGVPEKGLGGWQWDAARDDFVKAEEIPEEVKEALSDAENQRGITPEQFERIFNSEAFRTSVAKAMGWGGRVYGYESLKVDPDSMAYQEAMEVIYRRLLDGPGSHLLQFFSNRDLVDFFIVAAWAGPFGKALFDEIKEKKAEKVLAQRERAEKRKEAAPETSAAMANGFNETVEKFDV